jgi:hypothetical protein
VLPNALPNTNGLPSRVARKATSPDIWDVLYETRAGLRQPLAPLEELVVKFEHKRDRP